MFKIITIGLCLVIVGCSTTRGFVEHESLEIRPKIITKETMVIKSQSTKTTDSNNKEDDSLFKYILTTINNAINNIKFKNK